MTKLDLRYLMVLNIPVFQWEGGYYTGRLWAHDLRRHLDYIEHITLLCPVHKEKPPAGTVRLDLDQEFRGLRIEGVRPSDATWKALLRSFSYFRRIYRAAAECQIVHSGAIGWPIPLGYYAYLAARILPRFFINFMESSPWRLVPGGRISFAGRLRARWRAFVMESMAVWIARNVQMSVFTTEAYRNSMVGEGHPGAHVFKAVWVTREQVLGRSELEGRLRAKGANSRLAVGFAGRLVAEKGVQILLDALRRMDPGVSIEVRVLGEGPLEGELHRFAPSAGCDVSLKFLGVIDNGEQFYREVDEWDVAVVPSLSAEQPRIVYDAFARGVPVIASDTSALHECVQDGTNGFLFPVGDSEALMRLLVKFARDRALLAECAFHALESASAYTHERMHEDRAVLLKEAWQKWASRTTKALDTG
jgi:glycosyltransferase involved in cell wall biosynthesis